MSIAWIMFFKSFIVAFYASLAGAYKAYRTKRKTAGIVLKYSQRRNTYYDPMALLEKRVRFAAWALGVPLTLYILTIGLLLIGPPLWAKLAG